MSALSWTQLTPVCTEHELVAAVRSGSDRAFEELYARYRPGIAAYILGMVRDHARSEDIAQEVFISALRRLRETDQPIAFQAWIREIAKNACIDEYRRTVRLQEVPLVSDDDSETTGVVAPTGALAPEAAVERKQSLADLQNAFFSLSEKQHKILVMRELEGLTYAEIGERLGMSRFMVESSLFRARRRLSAEYNELVSGRRCEQIQTAIETHEPGVLLKLGVRQRRQIARHLAHCQPCRRQARMAGLDESFFKAPTLVGKIAALLPFPLLRWRRSASTEEDSVAASGSHSYLALQSLPTVARFVDPAGPAAGFGRSAATIAAVAAAGIGGGVLTSITPHAQPAKPAPVVRAVSASAPAGPSAAAASRLSPASKSLVMPRAHSAAARPPQVSGTASFTGGKGGPGKPTGPGGTGLHSGGGSSSNHPALFKGVLPPKIGPIKTPQLPNPTVPSSPASTVLTGASNLPVPKLPKITTPQVKLPSVKSVQLPTPKQLLDKLTHS